MDSTDADDLPGIAPRGTPGIVAAAAMLLLIAHAAWYATYTVDDAYISYRYAENLAAGRGLVFNPGEAVEGYTNFLWVLLLALAVRFGADVVVASKVLGIAASLGALHALGRLGRRAGATGTTAGLAMLLAAAQAPFAINAVDGLETALFTWLSLLALDRYACEREDGGGFPWSIAAALGAYFTRPDGALLVAALLGLGLWQALRPEGRARWLRWTLSGALLAAVLAGAHLAWRFATYGALVPNTFFAKPGGNLPMFLRGLTRTLALGARLGGPPALAILLIGALRPGWSRVAGLVALLAGTRLAFVLWSGGEIMGHTRFFLPALVALQLVFAAGLVGISRLLASPSGPGPGRARVVLAGALLCILATSAVDSRRTRRDCLAYAAALQACHGALGADLAHRAGPGALVATGDNGFLTYTSGLAGLDLYGLTDAAIARSPGLHGEKTGALAVLARCPEFIVLRSRRAGAMEPVMPMEADLYASPAFRALYRPIGEYRFDDHYFLIAYQRQRPPQMASVL